MQIKMLLLFCQRAVYLLLYGKNSKMKYKSFHYNMLVTVLFLLAHCSNKQTPEPHPPTPIQLTLKNIYINNQPFDNTVYGTELLPVIKLEFTQPVLPGSVAAAVKLISTTGIAIAVNTTLQNKDSVLLIQPAMPLPYLNKFNLYITSDLKSSTSGSFISNVDKFFVTKIDSSRKFPAISDNALLDLVQQQTFKYFWDFSHPVSGLARERSNATPETVTSGGSGFGIMAIVSGIHRNFMVHFRIGLTAQQVL
jgi:hypothetical protein